MTSRLPLRSAAWLLAPIVAVRAAGMAFRAVDIDECDWLVAGKMLAAGALPYVDFVEKKPILSFLFYAPLGLTGFQAWLVQIIAVGWVFATCLLVAQAAREWTGREEAGWAAGWLACLAHVACKPAVNAETMLNLPAAAALLFFVRAERSGKIRHDLLAGVAAGIATLFKQQAGILLVAFIASLAWKRPSGWAGPSRPVRAAAIGAAFAAPWAVVAGIYAALGHFGDFYEWNVTQNVAYQAHGGGSVLERLAVGLLIGVVLAAPVPWGLAVGEAVRAARGRGGEADPVRRTLLLTLGLTFLPVSLGGRFYDHYFIQFVPVLALCATPGALRLLDGWPGIAPGRRRLWLAGLALPVAIFLGISYGGGILGRFPLQEPRTRELARWIRANSEPRERMFVWGHWTPIYVLAERLPGTRHWNASALVGDFDPHHLPEGFDLAPYVSQREVELTLRDLEVNRPALFVDTAPADIHDWHRVPLSAVPALERYLHEHYVLVGQPAGAAVYRRMDR